MEGSPYTLKTWLPHPRAMLAFEWLLVVWPIAAIFAAFLAQGGPRQRIKWIGLAILLPPSVLWLAVRRMKGDADEPDVDKPYVVPAPVGPVEPGDDIHLVPEPAKACPDCGYLGIRPPGVQDGVVPGGGELVFYVCPRCHYRGVPIQFARREDYADFLRKLAAAP